MGVSQKSSAATAAAPAGRGPSQHAAEHDHGSDHVHGPDHGSADHKHGEDGDPSHEHGGIFGERTELIFALACGLVVGSGSAIEKLTATPERLAFACSIAAYGFGGGSNEHTSELQSLIPLAYHDLCLSKKIVIKR